MKHEGKEENLQRVGEWNESATVATVHTDDSSRDNGSFQAFTCNGGDSENWPNGTATPLIEPKSLVLGDAGPDTPDKPAPSLKSQPAFLR